MASAACRDCAQPGFGGPSDNRFTAYDAICRGAGCRAAGIPQAYVNLSNLTLFVQVTDLAFGGPAPAFSFERVFNSDDLRSGPFGPGWTFSLGDALTFAADGSVEVRRGSGRTDTFASVGTGKTFIAVSQTAETLAQNGDGSYTLRNVATGATRVFNTAGKVISLTNGPTVIALEYNSSGQLTTARYRGRAVQFTYDGGRIVSASDGAGRTVRYSYRGGRLAGHTNADGRSVTYEYDDRGNLTAIGVAGEAVTFGYDGDPEFSYVSDLSVGGNFLRRYDTPLAPSQVRVRDGAGGTWWYVSSTTGLLQSFTGGTGNTISHAYDAAGRRTGTINASGEAAGFTYDAAGNLRGIVDSGNNRWTADYSPSGPIRIFDPNGNAWLFDYDAAGNLIKVTDPAGNPVSVTRSSTGQIIGIVDPRGGKLSYAYNADGLITTFTDAVGGKWTYQYDGAARTTSRTDPGGTVLEAGFGAGTRAIKLSAGGATAALDSPGASRDALGRLAAYSDDFGNQVAYTYDAGGRLAAMTLPGGKRVTYQYDRSNRLSTVTDWLGNFALYRYDASGAPVSVSVSGGPVTVYQYDASHRLRAIVGTGPDGVPVAAYRYTLDAAGNRTAVAALDPQTVIYAESPAATFSFDAANRPASDSRGRTFRYDARGNLASIEGPRALALTYDVFGRLQSTRGEQTITYSYDSSGLRNARTSDGAERRYVYDLSGRQPRVVMETDSSNAPIAWYVYGLGLLWKVAADETPYFYHFDGDGNVVAVSTSAKGVVNTYHYDLAGRLDASSESVSNPFRARGEAGWMDDGNGLLYTGSEFLFPELRLGLPATADTVPQVPALTPSLSGPGACFLEGVGACSFAAGGRER